MSSFLLNRRTAAAATIMSSVNRQKEEDNKSLHQSPKSTNCRSSCRVFLTTVTLSVAILFISLPSLASGFSYDADLTSLREQGGEHDIQLLESLVNEDSLRMHDEENVRIRRDTSEDDKILKKIPTKKPTMLIKNKPTSPIPFKSSTAAGSLTSTTLSSSSDGISARVDADHSTTASDGNFNFPHPEDVTLPPNSTSSEDHHQYYNSTFISDPAEVDKYWIDADHDLSVHDMLSNSHRRAATIQLKFPFPFYGHPIKNITIATGGFLYLGDTVHSWLAATQYVAPLMANFDTSVSNNSYIKYVNNETHFVVQWKEVHLQDSTPPGNFSFQVTLTKSGDIIFVYKEIPFPISQIPDSKHPVKVGISDAYVIDRTVFFIRRKTIYEYHRADLKKENIANHTAIYFTPLPTCVTLKDCESCVTSTIANFECRWCDAVKRCSDGFDRHRQDWLLNKCDVESHSKDTPNRCVARPSTTPSSRLVPSGSNPKSKTDSDLDHFGHDESHSSSTNHEGSRATGSKAGAMFFLILIAFMSGVGLWVFYAYKNPQTSAGQFLIKYRPAEWRWSGGGDGRGYTAASIHM